MNNDQTNEDGSLSISIDFGKDNEALVQFLKTSLSNAKLNFKTQSDLNDQSLLGDEKLPTDDSSPTISSKQDFTIHIENNNFPNSKKPITSSKYKTPGVKIRDIFSEEHKHETILSYSVFLNFFLLIGCSLFFLSNIANVLYNGNYSEKNTFVFFLAGLLFVMYDFYSGYSHQYSINLNIYRHIRFLLLNLVIASELIFLIVSSSELDYPTAILPTLTTLFVIGGLFLRDKYANFKSKKYVHLNLKSYFHPSYLLISLGYLLGFILLYNRNLGTEETSIILFVAKSPILIPFILVFLGVMMDFKVDKSIVLSKLIFSLPLGFLFVEYVSIPNNLGKFIIPEFQITVFVLFWSILLVHIYALLYFNKITQVRNLLPLDAKDPMIYHKEDERNSKNEANDDEIVTEKQNKIGNNIIQSKTLKDFTIYLADYMNQNPEHLEIDELIVYVFHQLEDGFAYYSDVEKQKGMTPLEYVKSSFDTGEINIDIFEDLMNIYYKKQYGKKEIDPQDLLQFHDLLLDLIEK